MLRSPHLSHKYLCQIIASPAWFNVFQWKLTYLFTDPFSLSGINPQGFTWISLEKLEAKISKVKKKTLISGLFPCRGRKKLQIIPGIACHTWNMHEQKRFICTLKRWPSPKFWLQLSLCIFMFSGIWPKSVDFSTSATSNIRLLLCFWWSGSIND